MHRRWSTAEIFTVPELCWASSLIFVGNDPSLTAFTDESGGAGLRQLDTTGVDAAKTQLELIEFQSNVAVKEIYFDGTPENFLSKEDISKNFFHSSQIVSGNFYGVWVYLLLPEGRIVPSCQLQ